MNQYLKSAVERDKRKKYLISPLCQEDAEIIWELIIALKRVGSDKADEIKSILEEWKYLKDVEIKNLLLQWNIDHPEGVSEDKKAEDEGRKFVRFEDELIELNLIKSISKEDSYNFFSKKHEFKVVINKDFPEGYILSDKSFSFETREAREFKYKKLEEELKKRIKVI
jgi:hypothetical protein